MELSGAILYPFMPAVCVCRPSHVPSQLVYLPLCVCIQYIMSVGVLIYLYRLII